MGRPLKEEHEYFSHDTNMFSNRKVRGMVATHQDAGYTFYCVTLEQVYGGKTDYLDLSQEWQLALHADLLHKTRDELDALINTATDIGLFDKAVWESCKHLTSAEITERRNYVEEHRAEERKRIAGKRAKAKKQDDNELSGQQPPNNPPTKTQQSSNNSPTKALQLPEYIKQECWDGFVDMRKKSKKPMTDRAKELAIKDLMKLKELGIDPNERLDLATSRNWQGLIFDSDKKNGNGAHPNGSLPSADELKDSWEGR
jgi:hypothetical protein